MAFAASGSDGVTRIWVRAMDSLDARPLLATETDPVVGAMIWSPDSRFIAFDSGGRLKKIDLSGGLAQTLCDLPGIAAGGSWSREGVIILGSLTGGLARVSAAGGALIPLTKLDKSRNETYHILPFFLPDGRHFLYLRVSKTAPEKTGLYVGSLDLQPEEQGVKQVLATTTGAAYAVSPAGLGYLLFLQDGKLVAQHFDAQRLELMGVPAPLADRIGSYIDVAEFSASPSVLVYRAGDENLQLTWFNRDGKDLGRVGQAARYASLALSPDETRVIVSRVNPQTSVKNELLLMDFSPERTTRFTSTAYSNFPVWSADGSRVAFHTSSPGGPTDLYQKLASGAKEQELLVHSSEEKQPTSWSQDGSSLLYVSYNPVTKADLWTVSTKRDSKPVPFLRTESSERDGQFSPSGHWVAYTSDESGRDEVYLRTFPDGADKVPVSTAGGGSPRWRGDGKELFYLESDGKLMAVEIIPGHESQPGTPKALFRASRVFDPSCSCMPDWSVTADGKRFLFAMPTEQSPQAAFNVVLNWMTGLKR